MIHPDISYLPFFNVPHGPLHEDIGLRVTFVRPKCEAEGDIFTITAVQTDWRGELAYRVVGDEDVHGFGCIAYPHEIQAGSE